MEPGYNDTGLYYTTLITSDILVTINSSFFQVTANKMQTFLGLFICKEALHVSGSFSAHHQEHITV
jgi:hypothetical protein